MNFKLKKLNRLESVLLVDAYFRIKEKGENQKDVIRELSSVFQKKAGDLGNQINKSFRNPNEVGFYLQKVDIFFRKKDVNCQFPRDGKELGYVCRLYENAHEEYEILLNSAKELYGFTESEGSKEECDIAIKEETVRKILKEYFPIGFKLNSPVAHVKFKNAYFNVVGQELDDSIDIDELAKSVGYEEQGKIFLSSDQIDEVLRQMINSELFKNHHVFYYDKIYDAKKELFTENNIYSPEALKPILCRLFGNMSFYQAYFCSCKTDTIEKDVVAAYADDSFLTLEEINRRLPYLPEWPIVCFISRSNRFVRNGEGVYVVLDSIQVDKEDIEESIRNLNDDIEHNGFSVQDRICTSRSITCNPSLTPAAIQNAVFIKALNDKYDKSFSVITQKGVVLKIEDVLAQFCAEREFVSLSEVEKYESDIAGTTRRSLGVACNQLFRINKDEFVRPSSISIDSDRVDNAISMYLKDVAIPLSNISSFTSFPIINDFPWNGFVLKSYCERFSTRYRALGENVQSKPIGAIFDFEKRNFSSYDDLMAYLLSVSDLDLSEVNVKNFLFDNGLIARKSGTYSGIISEAIRLRNLED